MDAKRVQASLRLIGKVYGSILDPSHNVVLPAAVAGVRASVNDYQYALKNQTRGLTPKPWGYTIDHDTPLRFKPATVRGIDVHADIYCDVRWTDGDTPIKQDIKLRLWSQHDATIYDPSRDAQTIEDALSDPDRLPAGVPLGRVVARMHFDKANPGQTNGPDYHLQFGGKPESYELCLYPKNINVPRLQFPPMELFLACQLVAANLFRTEYEDIQKRSEWQEEMKYYQDLLLLGYYKACLDAVEHKVSVLDMLWVE